MDLDIKKLIVKIKLINEQVSGILISLPDNKEEDLIITVFHIFENYNGDISKISIESKFNNTVRFNIKKILYEKSSRENYDVALIFIDKLSWLTSDDNMLIPKNDSIMVNSDVLLAGFPLNIKNLDIPYLPLTGNISGYTDENNSRWMVKLNQPVEPDTYLYEGIKGMSGCPMYIYINGHLYFLGMQKNVPSKETSYYITNVYCYSWLAEIIYKLYEVNLPFEREPVNEIEYENMKKFKNYYNKSKQQSGTYHLNQINKQIFPSIINDIGIKYFNNNQQEVALITYFKEIWNSDKKCDSKGLLITGEGGSGKTVSLLETCDYCLSNNIFAVYIPLNSLKVKIDSPIKNYLISFIWQGDEDRAKSFIQSLSNKSNDKTPSLVLLLDGFNELVEENKLTVIKEIDEWVNKPGIQVVITSRYDLKRSNGWLPQLEHLSIQPLKEKQISEYLLSCKLESPYNNKKLMRLLEIPILLTLYANTEGQYINNQMINGLEWRKNKVNMGTIIWNYLQCQLIKVMSNNFTGDEILNCVYALEYIASYIGYKMQQNSLFSISEEVFYKWIEEAILYYNNAWLNNSPQRIERLERFYGCKHSSWSSLRLYTILTKELHIFILSTDNTICLLHQQFRDFFCASYYIEVLRNNNGKFAELAKEPIDFYVIDFISEIADELILERAWENMRKALPIYQNYIVFNMLQIYRRIKRDDTGIINFTDVNFDHIDLRNVSLCRTKLSSYFQKASFRNSKINDYTFYPEGHFNSIYCITYSPDGKRALSGSSDRTIREWNLLTGECINVLIGHKMYVETIDYSPDGKKALSGSYDGKIFEWNLTTGKIIKSLDGHTKAVYGVKYSFNGTKAISGSYDNMLKEWNLKSSRCIQSIKCSSKGIRGIDYSPDGTKAVTASYDCTIREWDISTGKCIHCLIGHTNAVRTVSYSKDGKKVLSGSDDCTVREWDLNTEKSLHILSGHTEKVCNVRYSPNGNKVLSCSYDGRVREWNLESEECINLIHVSDASVYCVDYSLDGKKALSGDSVISIQEWDLETCENIQIIKGYYKGGLGKSENILNGNIGLTCCNNNYENSVIVWDFSKRTCIYMQSDILTNNTNELLEVECIAFFHEREKALLVRRSFFQRQDYIEEWNLKTGECIQRLKIGQTIRSTGCYSSDGKKALISSDGDTIEKLMNHNENIIQEWDLETGCLIQVFRAHNKKINYINYSLDNKKAYSSSEDMTIIEWDLETGKSSVIYNGRKQLNALAFSVNGTKMVSCSKHGSMLLWDMTKKSVKRKLAKIKEEIDAIAISPSGEKLLSYSIGGSIKEWDLKTGSYIEIYKNSNLESDTDKYRGSLSKSKFLGFYSSRAKIQYLSNGSEFVINSEKGNLSVWSVEKKECIWSPKFIPGLNILKCDFRGAEIATDSLKNLIKDYGGIIE
ncbi:hypothetical protein [Clostridium sp. ZS1]|uniref:NACHT and WD40 repeat domain-containing protein n=1 Tax=Clostridium sp. ZS1 TaxID=2949989 RepID=UPI00207B09D2|nr:hypothetical protein [Clostridium sp. ZS1]